jgi:hypothetical protein
MLPNSFRLGEISGARSCESEAIVVWDVASCSLVDTAFVMSTMRNIPEDSHLLSDYLTSHSFAVCVLKYLHQNVM